MQRLFDAINCGNLDELPEGQGVCGRASACCWKGSRIWILYRGLPAPTQQHFDSILRVIAGRVVKTRGTADRLGMLTQVGIRPDIG